MYDDMENGTQNNEPVNEPDTDKSGETGQSDLHYYQAPAETQPEAAPEATEAQPTATPEAADAQPDNQVTEPAAAPEQSTQPESNIPHVEAEYVQRAPDNSTYYYNGQPTQRPQYNNQYNNQYGNQYNGGYGYNSNYQSQPGQPQTQTYAGGTEPGNKTPDKKPSKKGTAVFFAILALIVVAAVVFTGVNIVKHRSDGSSDGTETSAVQKATGDDTELQIEESPTQSASSGDVLTAAEIAEKVRVSNVGILIYYNTGYSSNQAAGEGSGIVMSKDSTGKYTYIITCAHVIDESGTTIKVQTEDGTTYDAEVVGYDTRTDVGVIKVKTTDLVCAEFGDSDSLKIGDPVYAVGNPGGVEFFGSFTGGYVSAINRPVSSEIGYTMKCIQHDAAINPGNSGGMLVNQYGQVVGINSQKITNTSYEGMGFAIPISDAKEIIDDIIANGYVTDRAKLGIRYTSVTANNQYYMIAQMNGLPTGSLVIASIDSESGFNGTDVKVGDIIIAANGKELDKADTLLSLINDGHVGDKITLTIARINSDYSVTKFDVEVTLVEDKGTTTTETQTTYNPYNYNYNYNY